MRSSPTPSAPVPHRGLDLVGQVHVAHELMRHAVGRVGGQRHDALELELEAVPPADLDLGLLQLDRGRIDQ